MSFYHLTNFELNIQLVDSARKKYNFILRVAQTRQSSWSYHLNT